MAQERLECSHVYVNYKEKRPSLNNGQSEIKVTYKHDFKRVGSQ